MAWRKPGKPAWMDEQVYTELPDQLAVRELPRSGKPAELLAAAGIDADAIAAAARRLVEAQVTAS